MMMSTSVSRRQKNGANSSKGREHPFALDVESSTGDLSCLNISPVPPPPFLPTPRNLPPKPEQRGRGPASYLWHAWKQYRSQTLGSLGEETAAGAALTTAAGAPCPLFGHTHNRLAPASAEGVYALEDSQQQQQRQRRWRRRRRSQTHKKLNRCGSGASTGRDPWACLKSNWCRIFLVFVVGALGFDLYLAGVKSRAGELSAKKGGLLSATTAALLHASRRASQDSRDALFPDLPSNDDQFLSRSHHGARVDDERTGYARRSRQRHGSPLSGNLSPQIDAQPEFLPSGNYVGTKPHEGQGATAAGAALAAAADVGVRVDGMIPEEIPWEAQIRSQPLQHDRFYGQRVAVVVPYVGRDLPVWWDAFAEQARLNEGLIDWIIFCDQKLVRKNSPPNIKFFPMTTRRMAWLLAAVVEPHDATHVHPTAAGGGDGGGNTMQNEHAEQEMVVVEDSLERTTAADSADSYERVAGGEALAKKLATRKRAASFLHQLLITSPYFIVEFKPALGWLFREYLTEYSHWAFGDLDVLFGNMRNGWLEPDELSNFDIITFSFGDQYRAYLRGQLTIHKNRSDVNRIWRRCSHLTNYSERLEAFRVNHRLPLESAEGCYSLAAASDPSLEIKFTVKALSDVDEEDKDDAAKDGTREVVVDGDGLVTLCPDLGDYDRPALVGRDGAAEAPTKMQDAVGPLMPVKRANTLEGGRCEHWIKPEHQTCVENVGARHTLFLVGGEYFKQEFINTAAATAGRDCRAGAFYHFQDHKRNYRSWNARAPVRPAHFGVAAGPGGIVPLPVAGWRERVSGQGLRPPAEHAERVKHYCLGWIEQRPSPTPEIGRLEQVCAVTVSSEEVVTVVDTRPRAAGNGSQRRISTGGAGATLGSVGEPQDLALFLSNAAEWEGPKIFAMALESDELASIRGLDVLAGAKYIRGGVLVVALLRPPPTPGMPRVAASFPQKALMNLVTDLCDSRYLFALPRHSRLSPRAFQALDVQLRGNQRPRPPSPPEEASGSRPEVSATRRSSPRSGDVTGLSGPLTLVVPFDEPAVMAEDLSSEGNTTTTAASSTAAAVADVASLSSFGSSVIINGGSGKSDDIAAMLLGMDPVSATTAVTAAEAAAHETGLALEHARVTLAAAKKAEAAAAKAAIAAEGTLTAAHEAAATVAAASAAAAAAAAAAPPDWSGESETSFGISDDNANSRSDSRTFSGGGLQEAVVNSVAGAPGARGKKAAGEGVGGSPLEIYFLTPTYGKTTAATIPATSYGSGDSETLTAAEMETMMSRLNGRRQGHAVDAPGPSIVIERHPPLSRRDEPPRTPQERSAAHKGWEQAKPRLLPHHLAATPKSDRGGLGRGGWRGGDTSPTSAASGPSSAAAPVQHARATARGKVPTVAGVRTRRLSPTQRLGTGEEESIRGSIGGGEEGGGSAAASAVAAGVEGQEEAEWVRKLLFSGPETPGLVVDLWSPGPIFLRHVEEFGDSGCMDAAYALGLWRAGSSFAVAEGVTLSSTAAPSSTIQSDVYGPTRRAFTSEEVLGNKFSVPGGGCLRNEAVANTASIYSAFLLQVTNVYRRSWSEIAARHEDHLEGQPKKNRGSLQ